MVRLIKKLITICLVASLMPTAIIAQNAFSAAYRVNESIISYYDIDQRVKLMRVLGASGSELRQTAIDTLIDERLQVEAARNFGIEVRPEELARSISTYAEQRNLTSERLSAQLRGRGVSQEAFEDFVSASLVWGTLLRGRFGNQAAPTENELNSQLNTIAVSSSSRIQLGEIALLYTERGQEPTVAFANQLVAQLRGGANFQAVAREHSRSRSAPNGGVIGWVSPTQLPPQLAAAIRGLGRGQVSDPIFIPSGVIIIKVLDARTQTQQISVPTNINISYAQLVIPHAAGSQSDAIRQAQRVRRGLDGCRGIDAKVSEFANGSGNYEPAPLASVPVDIGLALARLEPRDSAIMTGDGSVSVVVLCNRISEMSDESREVLRNQLYAQNMGKLAEGYLLELRRTSIIVKQ